MRLQLKNNKKKLKKLAWVTGVLSMVSMTFPPSLAFGQGLAKVDGRSSMYQDTDRTTIVTNNIAARGTPTENFGVDARYLVDIITSASVDVVTAATGAFRDTRHEIEGGVNYRDDRRRISAGYIHSRENDWQSHTGNLGYQQDFADHTITFKAGASLVGNEVGRNLDPNFRKRLTVGGGSAGLSFVLSPDDLLDVGYSGSYLDGYQESPYRFVYFTSIGTGPPLGIPPSPLAPSQPESVPDQRFRNALTTRWNHHMFTDTSIRSHLRGYLDDWGIVSATAGVEYVVGFGPIETAAFVRGYVQKHAEFYSATYAQRRRYMTADRELASFIDGFGGGRITWRKKNISTFLEDVHAEAKATGFAFQFFDFPRLRQRSGIIAEVALGVAF